jgi:hypothetical protein
MMKKKLFNLVMIGIASAVYSQKVSAGIDEFAETANQKIRLRDSMPLYLQKHSAWKDVHYGQEDILEEATIGKCGCGICSMAMVASFLEQREITPKAIADFFLQKPLEDYYVSGIGTKWNSFKILASHYGFKISKLGIYSKTEFKENGKPKFKRPGFDQLKKHLAIGEAVIVFFSGQGGTFTNSGHLMVLKQDNSGKIRMFDPDDSEEKYHYQREIDIDRDLVDTSKSKIIRLWSFSKERRLC